MFEIHIQIAHGEKIAQFKTNLPPIKGDVLMVKDKMYLVIERLMPIDSIGFIILKVEKK